MTTITVYPSLAIDADKAKTKTKSLQEALDEAEPGDTIHLSKGCYRNPVVLRKSGTAENPIIIRGDVGNEALLDGGQDVDRLPPWRPDADQYAFLTLIGACHVVIEKLAFDNCFPTAIRLKDTKDITIQSCVFTRFSYAIAAGDNYGRDGTEDIVIDDCRAIQDPARDLWSGRVSWQEAKGKAIAQRDMRHRNGAFFRATNVKGSILIHKTNIALGFNGIQLWNRHYDDDRNRDIFITRCRFAYIRDNCIEPERKVDNLWAVDNSFHNCHNAFSMDWVRGRHRYYFGNRILNRVRPGEHHQANRGGSIFKTTPSDQQDFAEGEFYSAFNTVLTRTGYIKQGSTRHWTHANNAISILREGPHTDPNTTIFGDSFEPHSTLTFFGDLTDLPDAADGKPYFQDVRIVPGPLFKEPTERADFLYTTDAWDGDLTLTGHAAEVKSVEMDVAMVNRQTVSVPAGYRLDTGTPPTLMEAFVDQSKHLRKRVKEDVQDRAKSDANCHTPV